MSDAPFVRSLRFALSDAEVEQYHRDGVLGPYPLLAEAEMEVARRVIDREIIGRLPATTTLCTITTAISTTAPCAGSAAARN